LKFLSIKFWENHDIQPLDNRPTATRPEGADELREYFILADMTRVLIQKHPKSPTRATRKVELKARARSSNRSTTARL